MKNHVTYNDNISIGTLHIKYYKTGRGQHSVYRHRDTAEGHVQSGSETKGTEGYE